MNENKYDEYDLWFADNAGNRIRTFFELVEKPGGARELYDSNAVPGWKRNIGIYIKIKENLDKNRIEICCIKDAEYPAKLREIYDPPYILYYKGRLPDNSSRMSAVVGSRKATSYGRKMAFEIGKILGEHGVTVVSGMALGADSSAHRGCLEGKGITAAVLGSGADVCTPASNYRLMEEIIDCEGCVLSEFIPGTPGYPYNYPKRNRIISGMSENVIVIEADEKSGTSVTAGMALEQGRDVFALPGNINSVMSRGTNRLIKEGAVPIISVESILEEMNIPVRNNKKSAEKLSREENRILRYIQNSGTADMDGLCMEFGKNSYEIAGIVTVLEIKGYIIKNEGKITVAK
ncbi:MAG: DNA-processing protein DprA [Bacillota bacterium]|nr:DNA-processing protein DprA [Bacillota bacterium]